MDNLLSRFGNQLLFIDGAMGTALQSCGLMPGEMPEKWNLSHPDIILDIHRSYLQAGCSIITANTFGANKYKCRDKDASAEELIIAGVRLARQAVLEAGHGVVALDVGSTGKLLAPLGDLDFEDAVEAFAQVIRCGESAGSDCILVETMSDIYEAKAIVIAAKENSHLPIYMSMTFDEAGKLLTGGDLEVAAAVLEGLGVDAIGINCGLGPAQILPLVNKLRGYTSLPIFASPNAGLPTEKDGKTCFNVNAEEFSDTMVEIVKAGACAVGGCCGTTPEHLQKTVEKCRSLPCMSPPDKIRTVVASGSRAVVIGEKPVIIGERINPTGKAAFKEALRTNDLPYILKEGIEQQDAGAHILDVNVGLPEIDEAEMMCRVVKELQSISTLPLQLDTSDPETMGRAMRVYNGKPLVNSVTAKKSSMKAIFPLVKRYGGVVIGLTITEDGIPTTAQGRVDAARLIIETAQKYGIEPHDIIIDPLTMAVSAGQDAALVTLEAVRRINSELGALTSLGVSNVSFGLPQRENVSAAFFLMALQAGLNAAIINPKSEAMMKAYHSFCVLSGVDDGCMEYISAYSGETGTNMSKISAQEYTLHEAIEKGLKDAAYHIASELTKTCSSLDIINQEIVPALDAVGLRFQQKTLFLPQLLMSAEAAKAGFDAVKSRLGEESSKQNGLTIVIATVKGDVHDIGKNIVKVLLENYGFNVIDLGKDVPPEVIVEAVKKESAGLVGLSALMTTTVPYMKETIALLRNEAPHCKIMVGGAVLTQEYADMIDADFYGQDAMASVEYATSLAENRLSSN